jgi:hypothetical protein
MIQSVHMNSCLAAQIRFMLFKGPGSFKKKSKIGGNVDDLKVHKIENFFDSDFGICVISLLVMSKY